MKPTTTTRGIAAAAAALLLLLGGRARANDTDDRIESAFVKSYTYRTSLHDDQIKINAKDGVVTLTGTVADQSHKTMAESVAEGLPGVTRVDNQLAIQQEGRPAPASDDWISAKVKAALLFHRHVSANRTEVYVKDGIVTLQGTAQSQAQKDLTTAYARDIEGVKDVHNELTVLNPPAKTEPTVGELIDDASVTAQVKGALLTHRSTSALRTKVTTKDGLVTLTGTARNAAEKDLVTKLVTDVNGVKQVINNMTISSE
jgi:hyperosmotically inducible periplasmic protein